MGSDVHAIKGIKFTWKITDVDEGRIRKLAEQYHLTIPVASILWRRGYCNEEQIRSFLFTDRDRDVAPALSLTDADKAALRLIRAIEQKEKILVFGDYDVDGVTSTSLVLIALLPLGANINFFLPNRERDGYGLSAAVVRRAARSGYQLILTVDNGITALDPVHVARQAGIDVIITDHHRPHHELPDAHAIVNPNRFDCAYPCKYLAGVGVAFKVMQRVYELLGKELPAKVYELVMLGTVADVVPLVEENRFWVRHGLNLVNADRSHALDVLATNSGLSTNDLDSLDIGFMIAPQINALGRLDDPREAVTFLTSPDRYEVERIGRILKQKNEERKRIDQQVFNDVEAAIKHKDIDIDRENIIMAAHTDWPAGVIGLVAGKLMHGYGKPTILFHLDKKAGVAKGSCRSIVEFDIFNALTTCKDLLLSFGGHACAAGLKVACKDIKELKTRLEELVLQRVALEDLKPKIELDAALELVDMNRRLTDDLARLEPFGNQNKQPSFYVQGVTLVGKPTILKDKHVKVMVFAEGTLRPVIFFNRPDLLQILNDLGDKAFHVAGHVSKNEWQGQTSIQLQGLDIAV